MVNFQNLILLVWVAVGSQFQISEADIGTASQYTPPYVPTACFGGDLSRFPTSNLFAAAGEGIWDNGAACGRQYLVRCISGPGRDACMGPASAMRVKIVDRALTAVSQSTMPGTSLVLSNTAYQTIAGAAALPFLNIEFIQI